MYVADQEEIQNAESFGEILVRRLSAHNVEAVKINEKFRFPLAEGTISQPGAGGSRTRARKAKLRRQKEEAEEENLAERESSADEGSVADEAGGNSEPDQSKDSWIFSGNTLIRVHDSPRVK